MAWSSRLFFGRGVESPLGTTREKAGAPAAQPTGEDLNPPDGSPLARRSTRPLRVGGAPSAIERCCGLSLMAGEGWLGTPEREVVGASCVGLAASLVGHANVAEGETPTGDGRRA